MGILGNMLAALADGAGGYTMRDAAAGRPAPKGPAQAKKPKAQGPAPTGPAGPSPTGGVQTQNRGFVFDPSSPTGWSFVNQQGDKAMAQQPGGHEKVMTAPGQRMDAHRFNTMGSNMDAAMKRAGSAQMADAARMDIDRPLWKQGSRPTDDLFHGYDVSGYEPLKYASYMKYRNSPYG